MSSRYWTEAQREAFSAKKGNFLVSAGAGSGKTSVLTQRIYELVKSGEAKLENLLVLTFTNKAAMEMKGRVRDLIKGDPATAALAPEVESASIMTFDAFALNLVKKYHYELNLSQDIAVVDASIFTVEKEKLLDAIFDRYYAAFLAGEEPLFGDLVYHYAIKDDHDLKDFVIAVDNLGDLQADKKAYFATFLNTHFDDEFISKSLADFEKMIRDGLNDLIEQAKAGYSEAELADADIDFLSEILACPDYDTLYSKMKDLDFVRKAKGVGDEADKKLHARFGKRYKELRANLVVGDSATIKARYRQTEPYIGLILKILNELDEALDAFKRRYGAFDFADIASLAREVARIPAINQELKARYSYIMIDEYQDTSDLQEAFISTMADNNLFAVGDIKQSIYRFRNANPSIFASRFDAFSHQQGGKLITLAENFRSRSSVLYDINLIFQALMSKEVGGVDYSNGQALIYGNKSYDSSESLENHHLEIQEYDPIEGMEPGQNEASLIAQDILEKVQAGFLVQAGAETRPCRYSDFAILIDRKKDFGLYKKTFTQYKVPLIATDLGETSSEDVVIVLKNLARLSYALKSNPNDPSIPHLFASLARSFVFNYEDEEIYRAIKEATYSSFPFYQTLVAHCDALSDGNLEDVLNFYIVEFGILEKITTLGDTKANYERLQGFLSLGKMMGRFGWGLSELVSYFSDLDKYDVEMTLETSETEPTSVALMSIHASKGLEFPIVYYPGLMGKFNLRDTSGNFLASNRYGLILPVNDNLEAKNIFHFLSKNYETGEEISEKLRLFYVALTRAKEKMILLRPANPEPKVPLSPIGARYFNDFLLLWNPDPSFIHHVSLHPLTLTPAAMPLSSFALSFKSVVAPAVAALSARASKLSPDLPDEGALRYGEKLHRYLELVNFTSKDTSWIKDPEDRALISRVLALPLFAKVGEAKLYHEYAFYDQEADLHGVIDLLVVYPDHIDLIDYKAKDIDDPAYVKQLDAYSTYLKKVFARPISRYLLSIRDGVIKGVN